MEGRGELLKVGEVAERVGVSTRTVKYYEEVGLVEPRGRSAGGFRFYGWESIERLERILRMKGMGYSLAAIRELLAARDKARGASKGRVLATAVGRLEEREREVEERIEEMRGDLRRAEELRRELREDIELCYRRIGEVGDL